MKSETAFLASMLTPDRLRRIDEVLANRTRNLVLVLEDVHDPHNVSACVRSAEAMGLQEVHVIAPRQRFEPAAKVTQGADKWLEVCSWQSVEECVAHLRCRSLALAVGALHSSSVPISVIDFARPVALAFGNEHDGASSAMLSMADTIFHIPMLGFSRSFNISVAAALGLQHAVGQRIRLKGSNGDLTPQQVEELRAEWIHKSVPMADQVLEHMRRTESEETEEVRADPEESRITIADREFPEE